MNALSGRIDERQLHDRRRSSSQMVHAQLLAGAL